LNNKITINATITAATVGFSKGTPMSSRKSRNRIKNPKIMPQNKMFAKYALREELKPPSDGTEPFSILLMATIAMDNGMVRNRSVTQISSA
jgi:hypothetical protein